jgi:PIN domain nuclease of toxin-antitoxin system
VNEPVLDSSVIIAIAKNERYDANLLPLIEGGVMSAVNFAEVVTRLLDLGLDPSSPPIQRTLSLLGGVEPFTKTQARIAGELRRLGKHVALGDRACMALAIELDADLYTADGEWTTFDIGVRIHRIR